MRKEDISLLAQLMNSMKDAANELEKARANKDIAKFNELKKQILSFQQKIDQLL